MAENKCGNWGYKPYSWSYFCFPTYKLYNWWRVSYRVAQWTPYENFFRKKKRGFASTKSTATAIAIAQA